MIGLRATPASPTLTPPRGPDYPNGSASSVEFIQPMRNPVESAALVLFTLTAASCMLDDPDELGEADSEVALPPCTAGTWCVEATPAGATNLHDVWAIGADTVFAVGDNGTIMQRRNNEWVAMASGTTQSLRDVHGTSASNVWAVGMGGAVLHYDGAAWSTVAVTASNIDAVWLASANDIFLCGGSTIWRSSNGGASFTASAMTGSLFAISGVSASEVYVTGENSYVRKWNGSSWSTVNPGAGTTTYFSVLAISAGDVWVSDYMPSKETMHLSKGKWAAKATSAAIFQSMHKSSATDVWGVGGSKIGRFNGTSWTMTQPLGTNASLWSVTGAPGHVWTVGSSGMVAHYVY